VRVLIADDHAPTRDDIYRALGRDERFEVCAQAADAAEAIEAALRERPDLCLIDVRMPGGGVAATWEIVARLPSAKIVMLTVSREEVDLFAALRAGAVSYLVKDFSLRQLPHQLYAVWVGDATIPPDLLAHVVEQFRGTEPRRRSLAAANPEPRLTSREWQVLRLLSLDLPTVEIARRLVLSQSAVRCHISSAVKKLGAENRTEAIELFRCLS
jgi:DNA-binding NarL/FixJ family response regulator